ncbi:BTB/POZ domain-containing protein KCTD21-like isoform X2 [Oculina patagonica]
MIKLNVGGHLFTTSQSTLNNDPGRFDTKPSEDGSYFIDRDGTHFRIILNYLRTGQLIAPEDKIARKELLAEAEFYQIKGIIDELKARPFKDSLILSPDQRQTLINWLKPTLTSASHNFALLYRSSRDGMSSRGSKEFNNTLFHSFCDCKGATVVVVKYGEYIFGGYTEQQWEKSNWGVHRKASDSFLFSLVNPSGLPPTKMPLKAGEEDYAIYCSSNCGPVFGRCELSDLRLHQFERCTTNLDNSYQCPAGQDATTFLTGKQSFDISEMEVFGFEK